MKMSMRSGLKMYANTMSWRKGVICMMVAKDVITLMFASLAVGWIICATEKWMVGSF